VDEQTDTSAERPGPIQLLAVAFPGNRFKGEILPELDRLKRRRIVRVLDLLLVRKDRSGNVMVGTASDLEWEEATALGSYLGGLAGLAAGGEAGLERGSIIGAAELADGHVFDDEDIFQLTEALGEDTSACLLLLQHTWARPFLDAVVDAGGIELMNEWVRPESVLDVQLSTKTDR
jgi:uncharacterized membrane protein